MGNWRTKEVATNLPCFFSSFKMQTNFSWEKFIVPALLSSTTYAKDMSPFLKTSRRLLNVREHRWQDPVLKGLHHLHSHHARPSGRVPVTEVAIYKEYKRITNSLVLHLNVCNPSYFILYWIPALWIRIRTTIGPHRLYRPGSGSVLGMQIHIKRHVNCLKSINKSGFLAFKKAFVPSYRR
jgi:hypothetical protein